MTEGPDAERAGVDARPAAARTGGGRRVPLWDTARFLAIVLVVAGHALQRLTSELDSALAVYLVIYSFHIPLLVLVSGHFGKDRLRGKDLRRIVTDLVVPYLIFETIWTVIRLLVEGGATLDYATASWTLWFLLALIVWRLVLPVFSVLRHPLLISVLVSVGAGYTPELDGTLALARIFALLPFFVLGWELRRRRVGERWQRADAGVVQRVRIAAAVVVLAVVAAMVALLPTWREFGLRGYLLADESYPDLGHPEWWAGLVRLAVLAVGGITALAVLALLPRRRTWLTPLGTATLYVYLLHSFLLYPLRESGILADGASPVLLVTLLVLAFPVSVALASPPVRRIFRPVIEPRAPWLLARD